MPKARRKDSPEGEVLATCRHPLARQVDGRDRGTIRRGEHPRASVQRLDLLDDDELDRFRSLHPVAGTEAMDAALALEEGIEHALVERGLEGARLAVRDRSATPG